MLTIAYYFLQVILCSGLMMGYYWLVLRNKRFHQYNRFYLLAIALLSWIVPLIKIKWGHTPVSNDPQVMQFLSVVADNNSQMDENLSQQWFQWNWDTVATFLYLAVAGMLLLGMIRAFFRLYQLLKTHSCKSVGDIYLIFTQAKGTPFSFFRYIFWNEEIDLRSEAGKQILQHELTHVQQKHSFDKVFIQVVLIAGWFNPFFWLIKKEMEMIHEFIADRKAVGNGDTASLAQMLLMAAYPQQQFALTNPFFFSPIKRRLKMLTNNKNPRFSYIRRLVVLPLLAIVVVLFAFRNKEQRVKGTISVAAVVEKVVEKGKLILDKVATDTTPVVKQDTVVIKQQGKEGETKFAYAPKPLSANPPLMMLNGRKVDNNILEVLNPALIKSVDVLKDETATAIYGEEGKNGVVLIYTKDFVRENFPGKVTLRKHAAGETGNAASSTIGEVPIGDSTFVIGKLNGINIPNPPLFVIDGVKAIIGTKLNPNEISSINIFKDKMAIEKYGEEGKNGVVLITTKVFAGAQKNKDVETGNADNVKGFSGIGLHAIAKDPLDNPAINRKVFVKVAILRNSSDGEKILEEVHETTTDGEGIFFIMIGNGKKSSNIKPNDLSQINWKNGTWFCNLKVAVPPSIVAPWWVASDYYIDMGTRQMYNVTNLIEPVFGEKKDGENFSVFKSGNPGQFSKTGRAVPINPESGKPYANMLVGKKIITQTQIPAEFPGGDAAWQKYLEPYMSRTIVEKKGGPPGNYTVMVSFVIDKDGSVTGVRALNDPGYGAKEEAERIIVNGPKWIPAKQEGKNVVSARQQAITFNVYIVKDLRLENTPKATKVKDEAMRSNNAEPADKVFTQVQIPAEFPGGLAAWAKYLERNLNRDIVVEKGGPPGKYTVRVSFIVDKHGNVSDVKAENDPGYGTKEEAVKIIINGPKWKPAVHRGENVNYLRKQSITWVVSEESKKVKRDMHKIVNAIANNPKTFFTVDGNSLVVAGLGSIASIDGVTDIIMVNGKRMSPEELNSKYKRSDFITAAANDSKETLAKYGKGVLLVSSKRLTPKEVSGLIH